MKKNPSLLVIATLALFLSCNKLDHWWDFVKDGKASKALRLDEMQHKGRIYEFFYHNDNMLDSIVAREVLSKYTYVIFRHGKRLDSVSLIQDGSTVSTNGNIQYDQKGRITGYTYFLHAFPAPPTHYSITYDNKGNIRTIAKSFLGNSEVDTLIFNGDNNLVHWDRSFDDLNYNYDNHLNPLYYIDNLFVMFVEEQFFWEFVFSQHNSTRKTYESDNFQVNYQNTYDANGRLIKKWFVERSTPQDSLEFRYAN